MIISYLIRYIMNSFIAASDILLLILQQSISLIIDFQGVKKSFLQNMSN